MGSGAPAVEVRGLVKAFGAVRAVDGVDLRVESGTVFGVLGPNGAGKTTTLR
ncbi:MAG TPA: ATP-binding cassette domain-containing protein, partial [Acidimicrobiia bacterium]|nr:ATP-binding cassette domain-containing protein [Acidimicrobiia bacterium]